MLRRYSDSDLANVDREGNKLKRHVGLLKKVISSLSRLLVESRFARHFSLGHQPGIQMQDLYQEIDLLTSSLFEEANKLLVEESSRANSLQKDLAQLETRFGKLETLNRSMVAELTFLKELVRKYEDTLLVNHKDFLQHDHAKILNTCNLFLTIHDAKFLNAISLCVLDFDSFLAKELFSYLSDPKNLSELFKGKKPKLPCLSNSCLFYDLFLLLRSFEHVITAKETISLIVQSKLEIESNLNDNEPTCRFCSDGNLQSFYIMRWNDTSIDICKACRAPFYVAAELISCLRMVHLKILDLQIESDKKIIYFRFCYLKREIFYLLSHSKVFFNALSQS